MHTDLRNQGLAELSQLLQEQHTRKVDVIAHGGLIAAHEGNLTITGVDPQITADGVTMADGTYVITDTAIGGLAERINTPAPYLRALRDQRPDIFDVAVNGMLHGRSPLGAAANGWCAGYTEGGDPLTKPWLLRTFRGDEGKGILRAVLSQGYGIIDHLDVLVTALDAVQSSGLEVQVGQCDLTESRMYVKIQAPSVAIAAPELLAGYRSPYSGQTGDENPTVFAGFVLTNSETGGGAYTLTPQLTVQICGNGMTMTRDVFRKVHLGGGKPDTGIVEPSRETQIAYLALVKAETTDVVRTFLDAEYVKRKVAELNELAGTPVDEPAAVIEHVAKSLLYTDAQRESVFSMFMDGGVRTAGGVMHAVTAAAQQQLNADTAHAMEADAVRSLELAAAAA